MKGNYIISSTKRLPHSSAVDINYYSTHKDHDTPLTLTHFTESRKYIKHFSTVFVDTCKCKKVEHRKELKNEKERLEINKYTSSYWMTAKCKTWKIRESHVEKYSGKLDVSDKVMSFLNSQHHNQTRKTIIITHHWLRRCSTTISFSH